MTVNLTPNYQFRLPVPGTEIDVWGTLLNSNWTDIDVDLKAVSVVANAAAVDGDQALVDAAAALAVATAALPKAGGTMTGAITLAGIPAIPLQAAGKGYVDDIGVSTGGYWLWDDSTVMADPGTGNMRADGATGTATTQFAISITRSDGGILPNTIFRINDGFNIRTPTASFGRFVITAVAFNTTWWLITCTYINATGGLNNTAGQKTGLRIDAYYIQPVNSVVNASLATMANNTIKGNNSGGVGNVLDLTATQVTAMLNVMAPSLKGLVPAPAASPAANKFLSETGVYSVPGITVGTEYDMGVVVLGAAKTQAHGLGGYPGRFEAFLEFTVTQAGYAIGDRVIASSTSDGATANASLTLSVSTVNVVCSFSTVAPTVITKSGGAGVVITPANCKVIFRVYP